MKVLQRAALSLRPLFGSEGLLSSGRESTFSPALVTTDILEKVNHAKGMPIRDFQKVISKAPVCTVSGFHS